MGAWGPGIFSDDVAADVRDSYREYLEDQLPDDEATRRVIEFYAVLDEDEAHLLWIALAAAQSSLGRLDEDVKARALQVIDEGQGLELWEEAGARELAKRKAALGQLRGRLTGPQPSRKKIRRPYVYVTDLVPGDVLAFRASDQILRLFRVFRIQQSRHDRMPVMEWLDWTGDEVPAEAEIAQLTARRRALPPPDHGSRPDIYWLVRHNSKEPDWTEAGFTKVGHRMTEPSRGPGGCILCSWERMVEHIEREAGRARA